MRKFILSAGASADDDGVARVGGLGRHPDHQKAYLHAARVLMDYAAGQKLTDELAVVCLHLQRHSLELLVKELTLWVRDLDERYRVGAGAEPRPELTLITHDFAVLLRHMREVFAEAKRDVPAGLVELSEDFARIEDGDETRWRFGRGKPPPKKKAERKDTYEDTSFPRHEVIPLLSLQCRLEQLDRDVMSSRDPEEPWREPVTLVDHLLDETWALGQEEGMALTSSTPWTVSCADCKRSYTMHFGVGTVPPHSPGMRCFLCGSRSLSFAPCTIA
jgi:hypothetical protein